jgi:hypothetical protein
MERAGGCGGDEDVVNRSTVHERGRTEATREDAALTASYRHGDGASRTAEVNC